jgi:hypothetical protein
MQHVYEYPRPYYFIHSPAYTVRADMLNGLHRFLADDDDTVRLNGSPLSPMVARTSCLKRRPMPSLGPKSLRPASPPTPRTGRAGRHSISMTASLSEWTQAGRSSKKLTSRLPGNWSSPQRPPRWKRIIALDRYGQEVDAQPGAKVKVVAAELEFPGAKWSLAFKFEPAQEVAFNGAGLTFAIGSRPMITGRWAFAGQVNSRRGELDDRLPRWRRQVCGTGFEIRLV